MDRGSRCDIGRARDGHDCAASGEPQGAENPRWRPLRWYKRRWNVERLFAWLQNFGRALARHEYYAENDLGFVQLRCAIILLRWYF